MIVVEDAQNREDEDRVVTATDIKMAEKVLCVKKWQRRWNLINLGRGLYENRQELELKGTKPKYPRIISKLI